MEQLQNNPWDTSTLSFPVKLTLPDLIKYNVAAARRQPSRFICFIIASAAWLLASQILISLKLETLKSTTSIWVYLGAFMVFYLAFYSLFRKPLYQNIYPADGYSQAEKIYTFSQAGMTFEHPLSVATIRWPLVTDIVQGEGEVYIFIDIMLAYVIPFRCLPAAVTPAQFMTMLRRYKEDAA